MKNIVIIITFAFLLTACGTASAIIPTALIARATATLKPGETQKPPTSTPTATIHPQIAVTATALSQAMTAVSIAQAQQGQAQNQLQIDIARQGIALTEQVAKLRADEATSTAQVGVARETQGAVITATVAAAQVASIQRRDGAQITLMLTTAIALVAILAFALFAGYVGLTSWIANQNAQAAAARAQISTLPLPPLASEKPVTSGAKTYPPRTFFSGLSLSVFTDAKITRAQLELLANGILDGAPLTHARWTPAENGFSEGQFYSVQHILTTHGLANWLADDHRAGVTLTERGLDFFVQVSAYESAE